MSKIADFTDSELWVLRTTLEERYGEPVEPMLADTEMRLDPHSTQLHECPAAVWQRDRCNFVIVKTGDQRYRCQFYYRLHQMYGTGVNEYDDLAQCAVTLLQVQADHDAQENAEADKNS